MSEKAIDRYNRKNNRCDKHGRMKTGYATLRNGQVLQWDGYQQMFVPVWDKKLLKVVKS